MEIANLKQPPLCTTLMGCVKGASDYFDNGLSTPMLFGLTGHAFLLNVHTELCPSGPYAWNKDKFFDLLAGIGIRRTEEVERRADTPPEEVAQIEATLREALDAGQLCMLDFLEHQLVSGYDENGLMMLQPWNGNAPSEVPAISFGSWNECLEKEGWAHLTVLRKEERRAPVREVARRALRYAVDMWREPERFEFPDGAPEAGRYRIGPRGYQTWISAVERGLGDGHGHWWNTQVWSECRENAAAFLEQLAESTDDETVQARMTTPASEYRRVSEFIRQAGEKGASSEKRAELLTAAWEREDAAVAGIAEIVATV